VGDHLHVVMGIVCERGVVVFRKWGVVSSVGGRSWVSGVVVVGEGGRGGAAVIIHEWAVVVM
jgi:hypothetical protein